MKPTSAKSECIELLGYIPVISHACRLNNCWIVCSWFFGPFQQNSEPYRAVDSIAAS